MTGSAPDLGSMAMLARAHDTLLYIDDTHGWDFFKMILYFLRPIFLKNSHSVKANVVDANVECNLRNVRALSFRRGYCNLSHLN